MRLLQWTAAGALTAIALCAGAGGAAAGPRETAAKNAPEATLVPFRSERQFKRFLKRLHKESQRRAVGMADGVVPAPPPPSPAPAAPADAAPAQEAAAPASNASSSDDKITNTQEADVDEGGIVKVRAGMLVVLRRGRLFTVSTRNGDLRPIDAIDAYPPGVNPSGDWYDEMLISGDRVIVIGYSYGRGGTEINRFRLSAEGKLSFEDAYHLRSNDYYSSRNFASRLIGTRLVVYSPLYVPYDSAVSVNWLPALRKWTGDPKAGFERIVSANHIYLPRKWRDAEAAPIDAIHTVTDCDLTAPVLHCDATSVLGPNGRTFYVSANAVYVWVSQPRWGRRESPRATSMLYRLPLDGSAPSAIGVHGAPTDQFSFREDWEDGKLNVLVRSEGGGDAMWRPEFASGDVALLRFSLSDFGDGDDDVSWRRYRELPLPKGQGYAFQNRYVGDYVLYGVGGSWGSSPDGRSNLVVASVKGEGVDQVALDHGVDRIEAMGGDAVVVGADSKDLHFRAVELTLGRAPVTGDQYVLQGASQGETRSHGFFFKPEANGSDTSAGVLGLPVARAARPGFHQLIENSAAILFIRRADRKFLGLGELGAQEERVVDDKCKASCVDWYGNARPIFLGKRTFALMGYELVEGEVGAREIHEVRRINFAPGVQDRPR